MLVIRGLIFGGGRAYIQDFTVCDILHATYCMRQQTIPTPLDIHFAHHAYSSMVVKNVRAVISI